MIPLPWWRIGAALALLALLAGAGWQVNHWRVHAGQAAAAEQQLKTYGEAVAARDAATKERIEQDEAARSDLAQQLAAAQTALGELARQHFPATVTHEVRQPDGTRCAVPRISPEWVRNWNGTAAAGSPPK